MTTVEYIIGQLEGLEDLRLARMHVRSEKDLAQWKTMAEEWFFKNEILRQFDRRQVRVDLGRRYPITIIEEHPELSLRGRSLNADIRLVRDRALVCSVRLHTTFERLPGELDPRGAYRSSDVPRLVDAMVSLVDGKYRLLAEVIQAHSSLGATMDDLCHFVMNIIRGAEKPEAFTTVL